MVLRWKVCGPKSSLCCAVVSVWGIAQLTIMGLLYHFRAVAFTDDLYLHNRVTMNQEEFYAEADEAYHKTAINCWIAVVLYVISFLVSLYQFRLNQWISEQEQPRPRRFSFRRSDLSIASTASLNTVASSRSLSRTTNF